MEIKSAKKSEAAKVVVKKAAKAGASQVAQVDEKKSVTFTVHADKGKTVYVAGSFNK